MALPGDLSTFTLTLGAYTDAAGTVMLVGATAKLFPVDPATGKRLNLVHVSTGQEIIPADITVTIGSDGTATVGPLPHTDNATLSTIGFAYKVEWQVTSGRRRTAPDDKMFAVPTAAGATVDYDLLDVADAVPGVLVPMGVSSGVADAAVAALVPTSSLTRTALDARYLNEGAGAGGALSGTYPNPGLNETSVESVVTGSTAVRAAYEAKDVAPTALPAALPNLNRTLRNYNDVTAPAVRIVGLGSSVGVGATLPDAATQAPSPYFATKLAAAINKLNNLNIVLTNGSVNGTIVTDGNSTDYAAAKTTAGGTPTVVLLAYGMNDGMQAQYHGGQTFPGAYAAMKTMITNVLADGGDPIVVTSPHPHTQRTPWTNSVVGATYAVGTPALTLAASVKSADWAGTGTNIPASYRHKRVNDAFRAVAYEMGVPVIDAERYWFKAVATYGEDALFDTGEFAHPNLLGHQQSYWKAIDAFVAGLTRAAATSGVQASSGDIVKVKGTNETRTSTTRTTDAELKFSAPPNSVWEVDVAFDFTVPTAQDIRISWEVPAGTTGRFSGIGPSTTTTAVNGGEFVGRGNPIAGNMPFGGNTSDSTCRIKAVIHIGSTAGQVGIQHGLDVTGGTATIYADAILRARRIS